VPNVYVEKTDDREIAVTIAKKIDADHKIVKYDCH
jgi:hypothetical protein